MYQPPGQDESPGWRETWALTRAVFGVLLPPLAALMIIVGLLVFAVVLFATHPALLLVPIAIAALGIYLFARWERRRFRPPG